MRSAVAARPCALAARIARVDSMRGLLGHKFVAARTGEFRRLFREALLGPPGPQPRIDTFCPRMQGLQVGCHRLRCVSPTSAFGEFGGPRDWYAKQLACSIRQL